MSDGVCFVCRMTEELDDLDRDDLFIVAFATGYESGATRDTIDWYTNGVCERHARRIARAKTKLGTLTSSVKH